MKLKSDREKSGQVTTGTLIVGALIILFSITILTVVFTGVFDSKDAQTFSTTTQTEVKDNTVNNRDPRTMTQNPEKTNITVIPRTQTEQPTPTSTLTPKLTPSPTPRENYNDKYSDFVATVYGEAKVDANVPLRIRGHIVADGKELIIVMNLTGRPKDELRRVQEVNTLITSGFAQAVFHHDNEKINGEIPEKLRITEVNNTGTTSKTLFVNTSLARDYYLNNVSELEFTNQYWKTERNMTTKEEQFVKRIVRNTGNGTLYNGTVSSR